MTKVIWKKAKNVRILNLFQNFDFDENTARYDAFNLKLTKPITSHLDVVKIKIWKQNQNPHASTIPAILPTTNFSLFQTLSAFYECNLLLARLDRSQKTSGFGNDTLQDTAMGILNVTNYFPEISLPFLMLISHYRVRERIFNFISPSGSTVVVGRRVMETRVWKIKKYNKFLRHKFLRLTVSSCLDRVRSPSLPPPVLIFPVIYSVNLLYSIQL